MEVLFTGSALEELCIQGFKSLMWYFGLNVTAAAGCIPLATDGICVIPNMAVLKKDQKEKLQSGMITC